MNNSGIKCISLKVIPPALWATGGFGLAWQHPSLQLLPPMLSILEEGFTPPPTSSPGLKTVVPNPFVTNFLQFCSHPGHHHFFIIFSTSFCDDFCSILELKLEPKSLQNRPRSPFFQCPKLHRTIFKILKDVLDGMQGFGVPRLTEKLLKSIPNRKKIASKM